MKIRYLFNLAALSLILAACSSDENTLAISGVNSQQIPFTATISVGNASTRSLTEATDGSAVNTSWELNEQVALIHNSVVDVMSVTAVDETTKAATISGTITGQPADGDPVTVVYPASAVGMETKAVKTDLLATQDGLLATISEKLDYRTASSTLAVSPGGSTFGSDVTLALQYAIWKLSLNDGTNAISASQFVISDGSGNTITTVTPPTATSDLYVAVSPASEAAFSFSAVVDDFSWLYSKEGVTLKAGKYYQSSVTMTISKKAGDISYATTSVDKTFGDANFTNELTKTGDGTVTYSSSDTQVAEVNATTGEVTIKGDGEAIITATVADGPTYAYATTEASYTLSVGTATMTVTATGYSGTYDGSAHGITVNAPEGATIKYGTAADAYTLEAGPTYTTSGDYTVYYQVTMPGYTTVTGSATVTISKAAGSISYATATIDKSTSDAAFTNALTKTGDGTVTYSSDNESVAKVDATTGEVTIMGKGEATITATVADGDNYTYATKTASYKINVSSQGGLEDYDKKDGTEW